MNVKLGYTIEFTAGIWWDNQLLMNNYTVTFKMTTVTKNRVNHNVALKRLQYLIQAEFSDAVFIDESDAEQIALLRTAKVRLITLPDSPIDQILGMMLYSKCNAVMEDNMVVRSVLVSSTASDNVIVEHNEDESYEPFKNPGWWNDPGPECCEPEVVDSGTIFVLAGDPWADIDEELAWDDEYAETKTNTDNVVLTFRKDETE
jgi:hypothetical protein